MQKKSLILTCFLFSLWLLPSANAANPLPTNDTGNFLLIPDIHLNSTTTRKMVLNPTAPDDNNSLDSATFQDELDKITAAIKGQSIATPEFIIFLGDMVRHKRNGPTDAVTDLKAVFTALNSFATQFTPAIPVFFVFGNHDSLSDVWGEFYSPQAYQGYHSPYEIALDNNWKDGFLNTGKICDLKNGFTEPCINSENTQFGYYTAYLRANLKMIALNTVMFTPERIGTTEQEAMDELTWLENELRIAAAQHESVLITTHVPFGSNLDSKAANWVTTDQNRFLQILNTYKNTIIGMLAAHTHMEEAKIVQEALTKKDVAVLTYGASLCTLSGNAPAFKTVYFGSKHNHWALTDYDTFNFTSPEFNNYFAKPKLSKLYTFSNYYCGGSGKTILQCAHDITAKKLEHYYTAGNPNYSQKIAEPRNLIVTIPNTIPPSPTNPTNISSSSGGGGAIAAILAGTVAAGLILEQTTN